MTPVTELTSDDIGLLGCLNHEIMSIMVYVCPVTCILRLLSYLFLYNNFTVFVFFPSFSKNHSINGKTRNFLPQICRWSIHHIGLSRSFQAIPPIFISSKIFMFEMNILTFLLEIFAFVFENLRGKLLSRISSSVMNKLLDFIGQQLSKRDILSSLPLIGVAEQKLCSFIWS